MVKTKTINESGQVINIPNEKVNDAPITISYAQAKQLAKSLRPAMTDKQREHVNKLVEMNKKKWEEKNLKKQEEEQLKLANSTPIVVRPKKVYKKKIIQQVEPEEVEEEPEEEIIEEVIVKAKPKKKIIKKIIEKEESEEDEDDDDIIQKTKKATKVINTINKLDNAINQLKSNNPYANAFSKIKF
jgi:hypothetical protein